MSSLKSLAPVLYLPHGGGPMPLLGDPRQAMITEFLKQIPAKLASPAAILLISAHWEAHVPTMLSNPLPSLLYDYYGFPEESYYIKYPAPNSLSIVEEIAALLTGAGIASDLDDKRGYDHGVFVPLKLMYPTADIPVVQLSLVKGLDPEYHIRIGEALTSIREKNILVVGSGMSFHNLRNLHENNARMSDDFDSWLQATCCDDDLVLEDRRQRLIHWKTAPYATYCHPREEHLMPLHVCMGIASKGDQNAEVVFEGEMMGSKISAILWPAESQADAG